MSLPEHPSNEKENKGSVYILARGWTEDPVDPFPVARDDYEFLSQWTWYAVPSEYGTHFVTVIDDFVVDMHYLILWAGLMQGATVYEGRPGKKRWTTSAVILRQQLEAQIHEASLEQLVEDLIAESGREHERHSAPCVSGEGPRPEVDGRGIPAVEDVPKQSGHAQ